MSLSAWLSYGWLTEHEPSVAEIQDLLALIERDLADSGVPHLSPDWRLNIAYNAALQAATAALAAAGYRASREPGAAGRYPASRGCYLRKAQHDPEMRWEG